jgi:hypothetical protein
MKSNHNSISQNRVILREAYSDVQPDGWAVTRMRARLRQETAIPDTSELALLVFKRYVLAFSVMILLLLAGLEFSGVGRVEVADDADLMTWFLGDGVGAAHESELEYSFLLD